MTRSTGTYRQLIEYMLKGQRETASKEQSFMIRQNLRSSSIAGIVKEFEVNEANRRHKRKNATRIYHEVYSIKGLGKGMITPGMLRDIAAKYLELRNSNAVALAIPHYTSNPHIHFMLGGVEIESGLSLRISKQDFAIFKQELDAYVQLKYPQLIQSKVDHGKKGKRSKAKSEKEYQLTRRTKIPSEREQIKQKVEACYGRSLSRADFYHRLSMESLHTYSRNGTIRGIETGRRFGFGGLGYDEKSLRELDIRMEAIKGIQVFRDDIETNNKEREQDKTMDLELEGEHGNSIISEENGEDDINGSDDINTCENDTDLDIDI